MKICLVTIGEPIFHPLNKLRLHRSGILSKFISEKTDHELVWFTSTFNHFTKEHMYSDTTSSFISTRFKMIAIKGKGYKSNVSFDRIIDHAQIAKKFRLLIKEEKKPDIIVVAFPTIRLCKEALEYGQKYSIPVLIDYRDMWPEVYIDILPKRMRFIGKFLLSPVYMKVKCLFRNADGILSITKDYLNFALAKIKREQNVNDGIFPLGYLKDQFTNADLREADEFWNQLIPKTDKLRICYFGAIGYQSNWDIIKQVIFLACKENLPIEFVICGTGDKLDGLKHIESQVDNLVLPGFVSAAEISSLLSSSDLGLCAFLPKDNYLNSVPGKAIEYMSSGLPILNSLEKSTLGSYIDMYDIGFHYAQNSPDELFNLLKKLSTNRKLIKSKKVNIRRVYDEYFDANSVYLNYISHLEKVVLNYKKKSNG